MPLKLDKIDVRILSVLQRDGRIAKTALAEQVNLSSTACWERLRRLEKAGYIRGYRADIAADKLGPLATFLVEVTLKQHRYEDFERFERAIREVDEIVECHATGGGIDYFLKVVTRDIDTYQALIDELLQSGIGIDRYFTYIVTRTAKSAGGVPIEALLAAPDPTQ